MPQNIAYYEKEGRGKLNTNSLINALLFCHNNVFHQDQTVVNQLLTPPWSLSQMRSGEIKDVNNKKGGESWRVLFTENKRASDLCKGRIQSLHSTLVVVFSVSKALTKIT